MSGNKFPLLPVFSGNFWTISEKIPPCSLSQALTYFLDITTPPSQLLLKKLCLLEADVGDKQRLEELAKVRTRSTHT